MDLNDSGRNAWNGWLSHSVAVSQESGTLGRRRPKLRFGARPPPATLSFPESRKVIQIPALGSHCDPPIGNGVSYHGRIDAYGKPPTGGAYPAGATLVPGVPFGNHDVLLGAVAPGLRGT